MSSIINLLNEELLIRKSKNPSYSMRAFAHFLDEHPSYLHKVIKGDIRATPKKIYKYCLKFHLSKEEICDYLMTELSSQDSQESSVSSEPTNV